MDNIGKKDILRVIFITLIASPIVFFAGWVVLLVLDIFETILWR